MMRGSVQMRFCWFLLLFVLSAQLLFAAETGENEAFTPAAKAFQDHFYDRAEKELNDFLAKFPQSNRAGEAALMRVQSLFHLKRYPEANAIITEHLAKANHLADYFLFWRAQIEMVQNQFIPAAEYYRNLVERYTNSPLRLQAIVGEAQARFRAGHLTNVVQLLQGTNTTFSELSASSSNLTLVAEGRLLLARALVDINNLEPARQVLVELAQQQLSAEQKWEQTRLLAEVELSSKNPVLALGLVTNALPLFTNQAALMAQALTFQANIHKAMGRVDEAIAAHESVANLDSLSAELRRLAMLKAVELMIEQGRETNAAVRLNTYLSRFPNDPSADTLHIKAGEILLSAGNAQRRNLSSPPVSGALTNILFQARTHFDAIINRYTNSPLVGKALLNKGWTYWEESTALGNPELMQPAGASFQAALSVLPKSEEQAIAQLKFGDVSVQLRNYPIAMTQYQQVISNYSEIPQVTTRWLPEALGKIFKLQLLQTNLSDSEAVLSQFMEKSPESPLRHELSLQLAETYNRRKEGDNARRTLEKFGALATNSPVKASAELLVAQSFAVEEKWTNAVTQINSWLAAYPQHPSRAEAEFERCWMLWGAGQETNAFSAFTNFVAQFPTNQLAPLAQNWVADYYLSQDKLNLAEQAFQRILQNTNWTVSDLRYQAQLMAARTAFARQGYNDARAYLTNLLADLNCPPAIVPEAWFLLGDLLIEQRVAGTTNQLNNYVEALNAYTRIVTQFPTNRLEPLAWGQIGNCHLQLASQYPESFEKATNAYFRLLNSKHPEISAAARQQAEVGIGLTLEKWAESRPLAEKKAILAMALSHFLNVVYGKTTPGEAVSPLWLKRAGSSAGRIAESLGNYAAAADLYRRLMDDLPSARALWESRLRTLESTGGITDVTPPQG
ncbi:MAG: tetratricopeptide repeat protein [Verrucomicrobiota bacterium]|nr:tetratricopeptide repeat protein [Verrucomicrobiota bacterium]